MFSDDIILSISNLEKSLLDVQQALENFGKILIIRLIVLNALPYQWTSRQKSYDSNTTAMNLLFYTWGPTLLSNLQIIWSKLSETLNPNPRRFSNYTINLIILDWKNGSIQNANIAKNPLFPSPHHTSIIKSFLTNSKRNNLIWQGKKTALAILTTAKLVHPK